MTTKTRDAIRALVAYCWASERADYEREGRPSGHIFEQLEIVNAWLKRTEPWLERTEPMKVENAETGHMEGRSPCQCGGCKGQGRPLFPGDPDRHDAAAGDRMDVSITLGPGLDFRAQARRMANL